MILFTYAMVVRFSVKEGGKEGRIGREDYLYVLERLAGSTSLDDQYTRSPST
jgi:hypothetical protein